MAVNDIVHSQTYFKNSVYKKTLYIIMYLYTIHISIFKYMSFADYIQLYIVAGCKLFDVEKLWFKLWRCANPLYQHFNTFLAFDKQVLRLKHLKSKVAKGSRLKEFIVGIQMYVEDMLSWEKSQMKHIYPINLSCSEIFSHSPSEKSVAAKPSILAIQSKLLLTPVFSDAVRAFLGALK